MPFARGELFRGRLLAQWETLLDVGSINKPGWDCLDHLIAHVRTCEVPELNACAKSWQIVLDENACFQYASDYYFDTTGFSEESLLGRSFLTLVEGDLDSKQIETFVERFDNRQILQDFLFRRTQLDGTHLYILANAVAQFRTDGQFIGYLARSQNVAVAVNDVIADNLFHVFDNCPLGVTLNHYETDNHGQVTSKRRYANPTVAAMFGYSHDQFSRLPVSASWKDSSHLSRINSRLTQGKQITGEQVARIGANKKPLWIELTSQPFTLRGAEYQLIWHHDITEQKLQADALNEVNSELENLSRTDGLTKLANRRHFDETIEAEWRRATRTGANLGLLMIDVDNFKLFNDEYGHPSGDDCLRRVAEQLAKWSRRETDCAARYGGEEFVVLLSDVTEKDVLALAEKIRTAVYELKIPHLHSAVGHVTISIGCAVTNVTALGTYSDLIAEADKALYEAKRQGRNRIEGARIVS